MARTYGRDYWVTTKDRASLQKLLAARDPEMTKSCLGCRKTHCDGGSGGGGGEDGPGVGDLPSCNALAHKLDCMSEQELVEYGHRMGRLRDCCSPCVTPRAACPKLVHVTPLKRGDKIVFGLRASGAVRNREGGGDVSFPFPSGFAWAATKVAWEIRRGTLPT